MLNIIIPLVVGVAVVAILAVFYKIMRKVDKRYKIHYNRLSYRGKMMRTLYMVPIIVLLFIAIHYLTDLSKESEILYGILILILFPAQFLYNYKMWKKHEAQEE